MTGESGHGRSLVQQGGWNRSWQGSGPSDELNEDSGDTWTNPVHEEPWVQQSPGDRETSRLCLWYPMLLRHDWLV
eukprot:21806_1